MYYKESKARWIYYVFYGSLLTVAAIYGATTASYLIETTSMSPKVAEALIQGSHTQQVSPDNARKPATEAIRINK
jgi:hypothetical protein